MLDAALVLRDRLGGEAWTASRLAHGPCGHLRDAVLAHLLGAGLPQPVWDLVSAAGGGVASPAQAAAPSAEEPGPGAGLDAALALHADAVRLCLDAPALACAVSGGGAPVENGAGGPPSPSETQTFASGGSALERLEAVLGPRGGAAQGGQVEEEVEAASEALLAAVADAQGRDVRACSLPACVAPPV